MVLAYFFIIASSLRYFSYLLKFGCCSYRCYTINFLIPQVYIECYIVISSELSFLRYYIT